jgi:hypothetical protein
MVCSDIDVLYAKKAHEGRQGLDPAGHQAYDPDDDDQAAVLRLAALGLGCEFDGDMCDLSRQGRKNHPRF